MAAERRGLVGRVGRRCPPRGHTRLFRLGQTGLLLHRSRRRRRRGRGGARRPLLVERKLLDQLGVGLGRQHWRLLPSIFDVVRKCIVDTQGGGCVLGMLWASEIKRKYYSMQFIGDLLFKRYSHFLLFVGQGTV